MGDRLNKQIARILHRAKYMDLRDLSASLAPWINEAASPTADFHGFTEGALADPLFAWAEHVMTEDTPND